MKFMDACGAGSTDTKGVEFYSSHEGLVLEYEEALTREVGEAAYNVGAHMLWIGDRHRTFNP